MRIGLQQFLTDPADTVCTRHRIDNPAPLVHQRQQAERQRSCTHIIDRKIFFQPVFRQPEAPVHHPGIIQQYRDLHLLRTQPPGKTTYRVQRGQIQRVKDHAAVAAARHHRLLHRSGLLQVPAGHHDRIPLLRQLLGQYGADPARCPRYHDPTFRCGILRFVPPAGHAPGTYPVTHRSITPYQILRCTPLFAVRYHVNGHSGKVWYVP